MAGCKVIGLYGGAGSGKSEAARFLRDKYNAYIIKADDIGHSLYRRNQPGYKAIKRICGKGVIDHNGEIDYRALSKLLFSYPALLKKVDDAIHPMVYAKAADMIKGYKAHHSHGLIFFEAALIPDRKLDFIDESWYIHSDASDQAARMKEYRNYSDEKVNAILNNQPEADTYRAYCDVTIENNKTLKELEENVDEAVKHCQW